MNKIFDTHTHYDWKEFDKDREELFNELKIDFSGIVNIGINIESIRRVKEYSEKYKNMYYSIGVHPLEVMKDIKIKDLENEIKNANSKLVAIGETGLDYYIDLSKEVQKEYFLRQIELANKYDLPIIIHAREAHSDVLKILTENRVKKGGIMHCYSGTENMVDKFIKLGFYIGIGGTITKSEKMQNVVRRISIDNIVLETDSPVLPPLPYKKTDRNDSRLIKYVISKIAEIKGISEEKVIEITTKNAKKIYNIH